MEKVHAHFSRAAILKIKSIRADKVEARITLVPNVVEKPFQCINRLGTLEAIAKLFTGKLAEIEHPICIHRGGDCCLYIISWEKTRTLFWKRIRNYSLILVGFIGCAILFNFISPAALGCPDFILYPHSDGLVILYRTS